MGLTLRLPMFRVSQLISLRFLSATLLGLTALLACAIGSAAASPDSESEAGTPARVDYLTLGQGAVPLRVGGAGAKQGAALDQALQVADGNPTGFPVVHRATDATDVEFVYALPAPTAFDRFAVPNVLETPSPSQTFFRRVEVYGSATGADADFVLLASATLSTHARPGQVSELDVVASPPVRWVKVRLIGGIEMSRPAMFLEFSEIIGNGTQESSPPAEDFTGTWRGRGVSLELSQAGPVVAGCYDGTGDLHGTVTGNLLRATGSDRTSGVKSVFVLAVTSEGAMRGVRSTNGAPFRLYEAAAAPRGSVPACKDPEPPSLGCGAVIHGIQFEFDSAELRPQAAPLLAELFRGLQSDAHPTIVIEGHTSSEGSTEYNQALSERRAAAVRADLVRRGLNESRLRAAGIGETRPIATNDDESGRSLNRRVEIHCL